jgi:molybdopterin-containing oxidoreductase family iron-sulfur binding subunit
MDKSKRSFLKKAGLGTLGVGLGAKVVDAMGQAIQTEPLPEAYKGKNWAMVIDTEKCREQGDCTACIDACHLVHNVPEIDNPEEEIKWIWQEHYEHVFPNQAHPFVPASIQDHPLLVFCNHCERPPCVRVCPTQATWKREDGIVMMDQHRCIGCRYCIVACPYGSRSFNWRDPRPFIKGKIRTEFPTRTKGVVEKCNFCAERLAKGQMPACVEACMQKGAAALVFGDPSDPNSEIARVLREKYTIRRKPSLGTGPQIYYTV